MQSRFQLSKQVVAIMSSRVRARSSYVSVIPYAAGIRTQIKCVAICTEN